MAPITVFLADRKRTRRAACLRLLRPEKGVQVVGEARSGLEALAAARRRPRLLLLDWALATGGEFALLRILRKQSPKTKVLLLTRPTSQARLLDALAHGARGYLDARALRRFLPKAVRLVDAGEAWVPRKMVAKILDRLPRLPA